MPKTRARHPFPSILACLTALLGAPLPAQIVPVQPQAKKKAAELPPPPPLGKAATEAIVARYQAADHWVQKAVALLSLNHYWHPAGSGMILEALQDRDKRLRAYGVEALLRAEDGLLPTTASAELVDELVRKQLSPRNELYRERVLAALKKIAPEVKAEKKSEWSRWWSGAREGYAPKPWQAREVDKDAAGDNTVAFVQRAFDLYTAGLDLALCIDSTGSMQPSIDAVCAALAEMVDMLRGISPKLRLGVVHYKELGDFGSGNKEGAEVITPMTRNVPAARKKLLKIRAAGGGDLPERVTGGLQVALGRKMRWNLDANKVVIVIGDAPPHNGSRAVDVAEKAFSDPGGVGRGPTTGKAERPRPFITSAIGVLLDIKDARIRVAPAFKQAQEQMQREFAEIAEAGGGVYAEIKLAVSVNKKGQIAPIAGEKADAAGRKMVEHILVLSFGRRFVREMRAFARIYYEYKNARWFR